MVRTTHYSPCCYRSQQQQQEHQLMSEIIEVVAREVLDSRGNPTVEVACALDSGALM